MRYFKDSENNVYAYSDIQTPADGLVPITPDEIAEHIKPAPPQNPSVCTPAQGLVALYATRGITEGDITSAIAAIPDAVQRYTAQIGFTRATSWERESATMQAMALLLGLTEQDLDALFAYAVEVQV